MKRLLVGFGILVAAASGATAVSGFLSRQKFMPVERAEAKYGRVPFNAAKFKAGNEKLRASMASAVIRSKRYLGAPIAKVREELGEWDGYFETDSIPAYFIDSSTDPTKDSWQLLFLPDKTGNAVGEVKIHKN